MIVAVDASVACKWFLDEDGSDLARRILLQKDVRLVAPELLFAEVGNVLWLRLRRREIGEEQAVEALGVLSRTFFTVISNRLIAEQALRIARELDHPVYDGFYLACALASNGPLVTADARLVAKVSATRWERQVVRLDAFVPANDG